jgi:ubiquitin-like protein Pup
MAEQMRKTAQPKQPAQRESESGRLRETGEKLSEQVEALLNDIDEVLEENADEFVKGYIQRGRE